MKEKMKKAGLILGLVLVLAFAVTACGSKPASSQTPAAQTPAGSGAAAAPAVPEGSSKQSAPAAATEITEEEALAIALADAGFKEADVTIVKVAKDLDDGITKYDVEFISGDKKYGYDIKIDGVILERDIDSTFDD